MPYIPKGARELIGKGALPITPGELNYCITKLCLAYLDDQGVSYRTINDVRGALVNVGDEIYRKIGAPYEDDQQFKNGSVAVGSVCL